MKVFYQNTRFQVVSDGCPGLKIYDILLKRVNLTRFGAFYDNMGPPYDPDAITAARDCADSAEKEDNEKYKH